ncbi:hypothetical protein ACWEOW_00390 [Monashia sp. NPDC004114]
MPGHETQWSESEWLTVRLGGVWILSALVGRTRFDDDERNAFWDCVSDCALRAEGLSRRILEAMAADRRWLLDEFYLDGRPTASGLIAVVGLLDRAGPHDAERARSTLLELGQAFARARGPFGRRMSTDDEQTLLIVEQLLMSESATREHNPLNSDLPI